MTPQTHDRRPSPRPAAARTAGALLVTTALLVSPLLAGGASASPGSGHLPDTVRIEAPGAAPALSSSGSGSLGGSDGELGSSDGELESDDDEAQLAASQEGSWFLGQSVDSVLGPGQWYTAPQGRTWYGAYRTFPDQYAYCTDAGLRTPRPRFFKDSAAGEPVETAQTAWALHTHRTSDAKDVHAALSALVRLDDAIPHRHAIPPGHPKDLGSDFAGAARSFEQITKDAQRFAGPYSLEVTIRDRTVRALRAEVADPPAQDVSIRTMDVVISLTSAAGHEVPGHAVDLTVTGAEAAEDRITTGDERTVVDLDPTPGEAITVEARAADLPATDVLLHRPRGVGSDRVQAVVTPGESVSLTASDSRDAEVETPPTPSPFPLPTATATYAPPTTAPPTSPPPSTTPPAPTEEPEETPTPEETPVPEETPDSPAPTEDAPTEAPPTAEAPEPTRVPETSEAPQETAPEAPLPPRGGEEPPAPQAPAPPEQSAPDTLPRTGVDATAAAGLALTLVAVGVGVLALTRRP